MNDFMGGIEIISEMSKEDLITELTEQWKKDMMELKRMVISVRMHHIQDRMMKEAGLKVTTGFMGFPKIEEDD
jgi:hypothetical protein